MSKGRFLSLTEQVANHLRLEIIEGLYGDKLPGVRALAEDLGIDMKTVNNALHILEKEGLLLQQGAGARRTTHATMRPHGAARGVAYVGQR